MNLSGILAIGGKGGLFRMISSTKTGLIVEGLEDKKRIPVYSAHQISALEEISIYTYEEDVPLTDVYKKLAALEDYKKSINHKEPGVKLREKTVEFLPDYDEDRVYDGDLKKLFQWYNLLVDKKIIVKPKAETKKKTATKKKVAKASAEEE